MSNSDNRQDLITPEQSSTDDSYSIFASKPFTFIVQGTPLYVHAALVADCSGPLDRMINGHLSEAKQGFALFEDVEEGTFVRFHPLDLH